MKQLGSLDNEATNLDSYVNLVEILIRILIPFLAIG